MKLYYTPTSPFVRKVLVVAHETGQEHRLETTFLRPMPTKADPGLSHDNPLNKIPVLVTDDAGPLYDSGVICEYLDSLHDGPKVIPANGAARWRALRIQALANGVLDAAVLVFYEKNMRPAALHWPEWIEGQLEKARQGLDALEREAATFDAAASRADLAQICAAVAIGWLEFRGLMGDVRAGRPTLAAWYEKFSERASMKATIPHT
jgi:glutathione S-transferase